ncbi:hypothetical protein ACHAWF_016998 [Thalassiosira exigua]
MTARRTAPPPRRRPLLRLRPTAAVLAATVLSSSSTRAPSFAASAAPVAASVDPPLCEHCATNPATGEVDYGNHNLEWEDGPSSWEEFGHDNDPAVCGVPLISVEEWERGEYWKGDVPVIVQNVTEGWAAMENWKKQEMLRLYPDAEATMGEGRLVGETGPDDAGKNLEPTTVKEYITKHMYNPVKYFFDRKIAVPKGMLEDCHPFPMPTRAYLEDPDRAAHAKYAPSKKMRVRSKPDREMWRDHLAISIGSDLQGLTFHHHREAWNVVLFGAKRWILWDHARWKDNSEMQWRLTRDWANSAHVAGHEWIRRLYPEPGRKREIRAHGHDCIQRAGEMMFVPHRWMHMVVNIGDTVSVISEVGLGIGEGKKPEDFAFDPMESSDDEEEEEGPWEEEEEGWEEEQRE